MADTMAGTGLIPSLYGKERMVFQLGVETESVGNKKGKAGS